MTQTLASAVTSPWLVPFDGSFRVADAATCPPAEAPGKKESKAQLAEAISQLDNLQRILFAHDYHSVLLVFQAMDAAGKDGTIRAVLSGINPAGCQVYSFKQPSAEELGHDFLWRTSKCLPERGRIGVFNRSYYEEVLIVKVHPEYLQAQNLPQNTELDSLWQERYESIRNHELHLARNGTLVLKFWLNVSREEQRQRFLARLNEPQKNWKFSEADVTERGYWQEYMQAYQQALNQTSRPWAPWYAIPADDKEYMRCQVAAIIVQSLQALKLKYPQVEAQDLARFEQARQLLNAEV